MRPYSKNNLEIYRILGKDVQSIFFENDGSTVAASRGSIVAVSPLPFQTNDSDNDVDNTPISVHKDIAKQVSNMIPSNKPNSDESNVVIRSIEKDGSAVFRRVDRRQSKEITCDNTREKYENWQVYIRRARGSIKHKFCISGSDLQAMLETIVKSVGGSSDTPIFIEANDNAVIMRAANPITGQRTVGVVSTLDTKNSWLDTTQWEKGLMASDVKIRKRQ